MGPSWINKILGNPGRCPIHLWCATFVAAGLYVGPAMEGKQWKFGYHRGPIYNIGPKEECQDSSK